MIKVFEQNNKRSIHLCKAMIEGIRKSGDTVTLDKLPSLAYGDWSIFYGQSQGGKELLKECVTNNKNVLYLDMGYWKRKPRHDSFSGYHKISLNDIHPRQQLQFKVDDKRLNQLGINITRQRRGGCILLAGLNIKAALVNGYEPYEWENKTIELIRKYTDRRIIYRPKPSWKKARPIPGTTFSHSSEPLEDVLKKTHCVVTRHSNVSIDALRVGIPSYTEDGVAKELCLSDMSEIENAGAPDMDAIRNLFCKIAYCQWNVQEMRDGSAWRWFRGNI